ncbi:MAG TPA: 2-phospho-L-lactate transferase [Galbitalea sp.]|jgi:LPPG:FO 2-phospho-L-lactate transferase
MKITVLSGGVGGARFLRGLRAHVQDHLPGSTITAIANTGDDMWLMGLRIAPDLDSIMYTLAGQNDEVRGWGRIGETERVSGELRAYGVGWPWFTLGDLDLGTHITRSHLLRSGLSLAEATDQITARWELGVHLIPATNDEVETHVVVADEESATERELHFQEWWTRYRAALPARAFVQHGVTTSTAAPGVIEAIADADVVLIAPSNPVVSIGTILGIPGICDAVTATAAPVVGISPIIGGAVVRGMADACLTAIGVETSAEAVARHYGARGASGVLDAWLVADEDAAALPGIEALGIRSAAAPLWMRDVPTSAAIAAAALDLGRDLALDLALGGR